MPLRACPAFHIAGVHSHEDALQGGKQDFWGASAFAEPSEAPAPQHQNLVEAGLTDKILAGNLFGDTSTGTDSMGLPMNKADMTPQTAPDSTPMSAASSHPPAVQQQQQQLPPQPVSQAQPASGTALCVYVWEWPCLLFRLDSALC